PTAPAPRRPGPGPPARSRVGARGAPSPAGRARGRTRRPPRDRTGTPAACVDLNDTGCQYREEVEDWVPVPARWTAHDEDGGRRWRRATVAGRVLVGGTGGATCAARSCPGPVRWRG